MVPKNTGFRGNSKDIPDMVPMVPMTPIVPMPILPDMVPPPPIPPPIHNPIPPMPPYQPLNKNVNVTKNVNISRAKSYNIANKQRRIIQKPVKDGDIIQQKSKNISQSPSFNLFELQLQAQLLSDLQSLKPIVEITEDSLGINWTYTKIDSMILNDSNYLIRSEEKPEEDQINIGEVTPSEINSQTQLVSQHSISSNESTGHDFNDFTYWLIKGKRSDLNSIENMIKTPGFNHLDVPRNLLPIAAQVSARAFFDPTYRNYLDQINEKIY